MSKKNLKDSRPTFYLNGVSHRPIRAAGVLLYTKKDGEIYFLMAKYDDGYWADLGGKTDAVDQTVLETAVRECSEETNCSFVSSAQVTNHQQMNKLLPRSMEFFSRLINNQKIHPIYVKHSKYLVYPVKVKRRCLERVTEEFLSDREYLFNCERTIRWLSQSEVLSIIENGEIHCRLRDPKIYQAISFTDKPKSESTTSDEPPKNDQTIKTVINWTQTPKWHKTGLKQSFAEIARSWRSAQQVNG